MTLRSCQTLLATLAGLLSPLTLVTVFVIIEPFGLLDLGFWTKFSVVNQTPNPLWISPIGAFDTAGTRGLLPYSRKQNAFPPNQRHDFPITSGSTQTFVYDWDDIQFSEIIVRSSDGEFRVLPTGLHPTHIQFQKPAATSFAIRRFEALEPAQPFHLKALEPETGHRKLIIRALAIAGLITPVLFVFAIRTTRQITTFRRV